MELTLLRRLHNKLLESDFKFNVIKIKNGVIQQTRTVWLSHHQVVTVKYMPVVSPLVPVELFCLQ
jgi:hypothetical protein